MDYRISTKEFYAQNEQMKAVFCKMSLMIGRKRKIVRLISLKKYKLNEAIIYIDVKNIYKVV